TVAGIIRLKIISQSAEPPARCGPTGAVISRKKARPPVESGGAPMTADEIANIAVLKNAYQQWHDSKGASVRHWLDIMTDDVKFRSLAEGTRPMEFTRASKSKDEVEGYIAQGDRVVALAHCSFRHKQTGKVLETPKADFHKFRGGKICEFFEFYDTAQALAAAREPADAARFERNFS